MKIFGWVNLSVSFAIILLLLAGCGNVVKMDVQSDANLNALGTGSPLPVVVRIYQLSEDGVFKSAGFRDLWKRDKEILGNSFLSSKEIVMQPGATEDISFPLDSKTKFVAGIAIFRNGEAAKWNFILPVSDNIVATQWYKFFPVSISLRLGQSKIEVVN